MKTKILNVAIRNIVAYLIVAVIVLTSITMLAVAADAERTYGDIDNSKSVNASDALLVLQHAAKLLSLNEEQEILADVSGDKMVNASDALLILQYAAKLIDEFPVENIQEPTESVVPTSSVDVEVTPTSSTDVNEVVRIKNINVSDEGILTITLDNDTVLTLGNIKGEDGVGVANIEIDPEGKLVITYTDGKVVTLDKVVGDNGISIKKAELTEDYMLKLTFTDGSIQTVGPIRGEKGEDGTDGKDGVSVVNCYVDENYHLWIVLSDGTKIDAGYVGVSIDSSPKPVIPTTYMVTFKDWDGTVLKTETVESGKAAIAPANPTRNGYIFIGWDKSFSSITSDLVVVAQYTQTSSETYTVTFKDWDGTVLKTETVESGKAATAPANPTRNGYVFTGWDKSFGNITSDLVVVAQYTLISSETYTVTFSDYDGTILGTSAVNSGATAVLPANPSKSGTTFLGWSGNYANVTQNETVKAVYSDTKNVFIVESASGSVGDTITVLVAVDGSVKTCGFDFDLFYDSALELVSYDNDLDLDIIINDSIYTNGIKLNFSSASDKTKQRDIIELKFKINNTTKTSLPIVIEMTEVFEVMSSGTIEKASYEIVNGIVTVK